MSDFLKHPVSPMMSRGVTQITIEKLTELKTVLRRSFHEVRVEMDDHLDAINQNSSEVQALHTFLEQVNAKVDKLSDRIDELSFVLNPEKTDFSQIRLTRQEQEVFLVLYGLEGPLTPEQVGRKLGLSRQLAAQYLYNLQLKGVPMVARNWKGELFYSLDLKFKDLQARKNVLYIPAGVREQITRVL